MKNDNFTMSMKGITLIALVVTIVVLLILASISIGVLTGESGIIGQAKQGKDSTEISEEKEVINISVTQAMDTNVMGNLEKSKLQEKLNSNAGNGVTKVIDNGDTLVVKFVEKNRYYEIDKDGNSDGPKELIKDKNPGDITTDENGKTLEGSKDEPYQINCIEDLCGLSNSVNNGTTYSGQYIELARDLDFKSYFSYVDGHISIEGNIKSCENIESLMKILNEEGFIPIGRADDDIGMIQFGGNFDGKNHKIENIYEKSDLNLGLFGYVFGGTEEEFMEIKDLTISGDFISNTTDSGGLIGKAYTSYLKIENIKNYVNVTSSQGSIAGLIGTCVCGTYKINNCSNYGKMINTTSNGIEDCSAGGILGYLYTGTYKITNCVNYAMMESKDNHPYAGAGGIIGGCWNPNIEIYNTCNYGNISGNNRSGGIIGAFARDADEMAKLINVFNVGKVISSDGCTPGGLVGTTYSRNVDANAIINCYYISNTTKGIGNWSIDAGTQYTESQLKSEDFVNLLNAYIDSNTDGIDTSEWIKWKYNENHYPNI